MALTESDTRAQHIDPALARSGWEGNLENIDIFIPSLERQVEIVKKLDNAFAEIELLAARIQIEKDNAVALRQSLLSITFTREDAVA